MAFMSGLVTTHATPLWDIDFSSNHFTAGQPPATGTAVAGAINDRPTGYTTGSAGNSVLVQESFTAGSTTMTGQPVVMTRAYEGGGVNMTLTGHSDDYTSPAPFTLGFDMMLRADPYEGTGGPAVGAGNFLEVVLRNNSSVGSEQNLMRMIFISNGTLQLINNFGVSQTFSNAYSLNQIHHVSGVMNADATQFTVYVDNVEVATVNWTYSGNQADTLGGLSTIIFRNGTSTNTAVWSGALNNIEITPIPEPSTALLGIALLPVYFLIFQQRKRRGL